MRYTGDYKKKLPTVTSRHYLFGENSKNPTKKQEKNVLKPNQIH